MALVAEAVEPTDSWNHPLNSEWSIAQLTVSQVYWSKMLPLGLSRFCSSFISFWQKMKTSQLFKLFLDFSLHILDFVALKFSMFRLDKIWTKYPLAERLLKSYWTPESIRPSPFIPFIWQLHAAFNFKAAPVFWKKAKWRV